MHAAYFELIFPADFKFRNDSTFSSCKSELPPKQVWLYIVKAGQRDS